MREATPSRQLPPQVLIILALVGAGGILTGIWGIQILGALVLLASALIPVFLLPNGPEPRVAADQVGTRDAIEEQTQIFGAQVNEVQEPTIGDSTPLTCPQFLVQAL